MKTLCRRIICVMAVTASAATLVYSADQRLIDAVRNKDAVAVRALLNEHVDVNTPGADGSTALHWAAHWNDAGMVDLLVGNGAHASVANDYGATPLYVACLNRSTPVVERLLKAGANPNAALLNGETALMTCARTGDAASVRALISRGAAVNATEQLHHQTALMWAAAQKHPDVVKTLIDAGADVRARSRVYTQTVSSDLRTNRLDLAFTVRRGGSTPLLFAARVGDLESAKLLIAAKADVNDALPDGTSVLAEAAYNAQSGVAAYLLEQGADPNAAVSGFTALHAAVLRSEVDLVKALLKHGANPNAQFTKGTPLRRSSTDYNLPATLIGATPYLLAAKFLEVDIMRALLSAGADPRLPMKDGTTPLMAAAGIGARVNQNRRGRTTIDGAVLEDESLVVEAVKVALAKCDIDAVNVAGETALHGAVPMGYDRVVQLLADHGAHLEVKNKQGQTPLALALVESNNDGFQPRISRPNTAELLRRLGATK